MGKYEAAGGGSLFFLGTQVSNSCYKSYLFGVEGAFKDTQRRLSPTAESGRCPTDEVARSLGYLLEHHVSFTWGKELRPSG